MVLGRGMKLWLLQVRQIRGGQEWKQGDKGLLGWSKGERIVAWARTAIKGWWIKVKVLVLPKRMEMGGEGVSGGCASDPVSVWLENPRVHKNTA